jgi:hypothetical protein
VLFLVRSVRVCYNAAVVAAGEEDEGTDQFDSLAFAHTRDAGLFGVARDVLAGRIACRVERRTISFLFGSSGFVGVTKCSDSKLTFSSIEHLRSPWLAARVDTNGAPTSTMAFA